MSTKVSVIICTHNPRADYLQRTLDALQTQSLPKSEWELILIDNASAEPLDGRWDLSWYPGARIVREEQLGLTPARLKGIQEGKSNLFCFVDDDNLLDSDYLEQGYDISKKRPDLGAWGGQQEPVFEQGAYVENWKREFWTAILKQDIWSNNYDRATAPIGAGMFLRNSVAVEYLRKVRFDPIRSRLDRSGSGLSSCGDIDMAFTACDLGLGTGRFVSLKLKHLMPTSRLENAYIEKLCEGFGYSEAILSAVRGKAPSRKSRVDRLVDAYKWARLPKDLRVRLRARTRGHNRAVAEIKATT